MCTWHQCDAPERPQLVEFGYDGRVLSAWQSHNAEYCSDATEIRVEQ